MKSCINIETWFNLRLICLFVNEGPDFFSSKNKFGFNKLIQNLKYVV